MRIDPLSPDMQTDSAASKEAAVALMREKVAKAFGAEPAAVIEMTQAAADKTPSKHQLFMRDLAASGKSLAEIQTEWHRYYTMLPDEEKRQVWQEFYDASQHTPYRQLFDKHSDLADKLQPMPTAQANTTTAVPSTAASAPKQTTIAAARKFEKPPKVPKTKVGKAARKAKHSIKQTIDKGERLGINQHLRSLWFGLRVGIVVLVFLLFGFFNEMFVAPFIQPSRKMTDTPVIISDVVANSAAPTIIIPKINVQVPVDFTLTSSEEATIQESLKGGVVHYPSTVKPGQNGNGAYFGHSSQNMLNSGKFKYAFISLRQLTTGDVFMITYQGKVYAYEVFAREVVKPTQVEVINDTKGKQATATLITCDPPGISSNRLVVWGEQISPSVSTNTIPTIDTDTSLTPAELTGKGDSAWTRFVRILEFWKPDTTSSE